ncbi:preprotein translocase subunit TatA [Nesterenkonia alba]|uniref:preprotein translocase subunit TatA n=1 Tax=Nesterenkonia alba TaxID=515814 RepID=UPI0003B51589|nr:preprotein translocase subunit TatA [Nesterenkonia alba]
MFGISGYQLLILIVLAIVLIGPERLPDYTRTLADWVRQLRRMAVDAKVRFRQETGTDFDDVDWHKYDPRQYDPRRIIREALAEEIDDVRGVTNEVRAVGRDIRSTGRGVRREAQKTVDPRELFSSAAPKKTGGALAAGVAGSATTGAASSGGVSASTDEADTPGPAPFDIDAT